MATLRLRLARHVSKRALAYNAPHLDPNGTSVQGCAIRIQWHQVRLSLAYYNIALSASGPLYLRGTVRL
ncbi:hypothetical protein VTJ04DRAFT_9666 [Mycothermus thermophilus]|uniref:uncharacterized protein n=1 Tax=Humicola insolens TaxID=85995 RepID=UPI0037449B5A